MELAFVKLQLLLLLLPLPPLLRIMRTCLTSALRLASTPTASLACLAFLPSPTVPSLCSSQQVAGCNRAAAHIVEVHADLCPSLSIRLLVWPLLFP